MRPLAITTLLLPLLTLAACTGEDEGAGPLIQKDHPALAVAEEIFDAIGKAKAGEISMDEGARRIAPHLSPDLHTDIPKSQGQSPEVFIDWFDNVLRSELLAVGDLAHLESHVGSEDLDVIDDPRQFFMDYDLSIDNVLVVYDDLVWVFQEEDGGWKLRMAVR